MLKFQNTIYTSQCKFTVGAIVLWIASLFITTAYCQETKMQLPTNTSVYNAHKPAVKKPALVKAATEANKLTIATKVGFDVNGLFYSSEDDKIIVTANCNKYGINSSAYVGFIAEYKAADNFKYGVQIGVQTNAVNMLAYPTYLYIKSDVGTIELGSGKSAGAQLRIMGGKSDVSGASNYTDIINMDPEKRMTYIIGASGFIDKRAAEEFSRKITYVTSDISGFKMGISYVPDTTNMGVTGLPDGEHHERYKFPLDQDKDYHKIDFKDAFSGGVSYKYKFTDTYSVELAATGEYGTTVVREGKRDGAIISDAKYHDLFTYNIGGQVTFDDATIAAGFLNRGTSAIPKDKAESHGSNYIWSVSGSYKFTEDIKASISYLRSEYFGKNNASCGTFGIESQIEEKLISYAAITVYSSKGEYVIQKALALSMPGTLKTPAPTITDHQSSGAIITVGIKFDM